MNGKSVLGMLFANIHEEALDTLTAMRTMGSVPFCSRFRLIDFPLSNLVESGVTKIGVVTNSNFRSASKDAVELDELKPYPYLVYEQGERNSFYFSEEFLSVLDMPKNIQVRDRATLFNLAIGLNGFTVSSGVIDKELNGEDIIAKPLNIDANMRIGLIKKKNIMLSRYALAYIEAIKKCVAID